MAGVGSFCAERPGCTCPPCTARIRTPAKASNILVTRGLPIIKAIVHLVVAAIAAITIWWACWPESAEEKAAKEAQKIEEARAELVPGKLNALQDFLSHGEAILTEGQAQTAQLEAYPEVWCVHIGQWRGQRGDLVLDAEPWNQKYPDNLYLDQRFQPIYDAYDTLLDMTAECYRIYGIG